MRVMVEMRKYQDKTIYTYPVDPNSVRGKIEPLYFVLKGKISRYEMTIKRAA